MQDFDDDDIMTERGAINWAEEAEEGMYLAEYDLDDLNELSDPGSRCGYDDQTLAAVEAVLRERGLTLTADDCGLVVERRPIAGW